MTDRGLRSKRWSKGRIRAISWAASRKVIERHVTRRIVIIEHPQAVAPAPIVVSRPAGSSGSGAQSNPQPAPVPAAAPAPAPTSTGGS